MATMEAQLELFTGGPGLDSRPAIPVTSAELCVDDNSFIPIEVVDLMSHALRYEAEENGLRGFVSPSILQQHLIEKNEFLPDDMAVPATSRGVNMHYLASEHYVLSYKDFTDEAEQNPRITIFDSLVGSERTQERRRQRLVPQLELIYGLGTITSAGVRFLCAQNQGDGNDCAFFTIGKIFEVRRTESTYLYLNSNRNKVLIDKFDND